MDIRIKCSIILPVYNAQQYIGRSVASILNQSFKDFELLIIDDASADDTVQIIMNINDNRIRLIRHSQNKGVCEARNTGIQEARGEWISFIDSDDAWHKDRLAKLIDFAIQNPNAFIGSNVKVCRMVNNSETVVCKLSYAGEKFNGDCSVFSDINEVIQGGFIMTWPLLPLRPIQEHNIRFRWKGDDWFAFIIELLDSKLKYIVLKEPLYYYFITPNSLSSKSDELYHQFKFSKYIMTLNKLNQESLSIIRRNARFIQARLLLSLIKNKRWDNEVMCNISITPASILYMFILVLNWIKRECQFHFSFKQAKAI
jgi:glycosyltransferase involved in cell wall biosynthesis